MEYNSMILNKVNRKSKLISFAPGRTCLFGDHQDYLGLPVIACAINRHIKLTALKNEEKTFNINKPDIGKKRSIDIYDEIGSVEKGDHLRSSLKVLRRYGCIPNIGYDITISGNLPINAGTSSSSAVVVSWVQFLLEAFGADDKITPELISQIAYEAEVLEHGNPGGKMDQYSIGLGNIMYLETGENNSYELFDRPIPGLIIGESGIPKETIGVLNELKENAWQAIHTLAMCHENFNIENVEKRNVKKLSHHLPDRLEPFFYAAVSNHDITKKALSEFKKDHLDVEKIGVLMNEHHAILRDFLKITLPKIDCMIEGALKVGAYGAKIVGSGKGGSIVAIAPEGKEQQVIDEIIKAGGKDAYLVKVDPGARIL
ncbi:mevalonate kinase [Aquimarina sp. Aq78]|uniref:mevalonate kinase family protein n=2 Tax=Aquimarina sp. Aq78 TaxID=1191889 RepID=UPI001F3A7F73|nr:galactokinase family protein [Aquimarina sp. Aq78]